MGKKRAAAITCDRCGEECNADEMWLCDDMKSICVCCWEKQCAEEWWEEVGG